ncbi:hypothetical protein PGTUg99_011743 [Puccinia graminis f. sp. tritici]|uniref:Uncharacterized protein n=1 Tax=Puccinia graminis f. sp. tritici TaxID=56615 RepID=A0A5B0SJH9_PUCGR|nr:hypothetical protein PGTUg99_011743 [Puccinia graminis f. sp. tritici]
MNMNIPQIDFEAVVAAALEKQARTLQQERECALQQQADHFNHTLAELQTQIQALSANSSHSATQPANNPTATTPNRSSTSKSSNKSKEKGKPITPLRGVRATSEPAAVVKKTPTSALKKPKTAVTPSPSQRKRHPAQLLNVETPKQYKSTKDALFLHIRMLWGLFEQNSVPAKVNPDLAQEFHARFQTSDQIEQAVNHPESPQVISQEDILSLRQGRAGRFKLGRGLANIDEMQILYVHAVFSKVGIRVWGPNLEESHDSLFNSACRITALNTFRQLASSGAYQYMNINHSCLNELSFLVNAYNHYVHFVMEACYKKEMKEIGKHAKDEKKKAVQKNRERLRQSRYEYAVTNKLPERYLKIINNTSAHSDDEFDPQSNVFVIKTLKYRSNNANIFFRRLDVEMLKADQLAGKQGRKRVRKLPKVPVPSEFIKPPIGLPLDFYHRGWIKSLKESDQRRIPDSESVAFLPDAKLSLLPTKVPDEKLGDKAFCAKFRDLIVEPYGLSFLHGNQESSEDEDNSSDSDDIEVDTEDNKEEEEEEEESLFLDEGDYGDLYDNESDVENTADAKGMEDN